MAWSIVNFDGLYECNDRNRPWKPGEKRRAGPLAYFRGKVNGGNWSPSYRAMLARAGQKQAALAFGLYIKLVEIVCEQDANEREKGEILTRRGEPATAEDIAVLAGFSLDSVTRGLQILSDSQVGWIHNGNSPESPEISGKSPTSQVKTRQDRSDQNKGEGDVQTTLEIRTQWNALADDLGLKRSRSLSKTRRAKLNTRLREPEFDWPAILAKIRQSQFLQGKTKPRDGCKPFMVTFGWLIHNDENYLKVLEGNYDDGEKPQSPGERMAATLEKIGDEPD